MKKNALVQHCYCVHLLHMCDLMSLCRVGQVGEDIVVMLGESKLVLLQSGGVVVGVNHCFLLYKAGCRGVIQ